MLSARFIERKPIVNGIQPTPQQLKALRLAAGLTQKQAAELVGAQERSWKYYEAGRPIPYSKWRIFLLETGSPSSE
jgi:DNA-binding XRE family transcriptional regulator